MTFRTHNVTNISRSWNSGEHLIFSTVALNEGGGYDKNNGIFTAPRGGTYLFTVQLCTRHGKWILAQIKTSGVTAGSINNVDKSYNTCATATAITSLKKGERVWVEVSNSSGEQTLRQNSADSLNIFSGTLLGN